MNKLLKITVNASNQLKKIAINNNCNNIFFYVKGGGCNGFNYKFEPMIDESKYSSLDFSNSVNLDEKYNVIICNKSMLHLIGTEIDWKKDVMGEAFDFKNPNAASSCGCGTSFSTKPI